MSYSLNSVIINPSSKSSPKNAVILCHGYGGDGNDSFWVSEGDDVILTGGDTDTLHLSYGYKPVSLTTDSATGSLELVVEKNGQEHSVTVESHQTEPLSTIRIYVNADHSQYEEYGLSVSYNAAFNLYRATTNIPTVIGGSSENDALPERQRLSYLP